MLNLRSPDYNPAKSGDYSPEKRIAKRMVHEGTIMLCDDAAEYYTYARARNLSGDGMYFESDYGFKRGRILDIRLDNPPFKTAPKYYTATVRWCKPLSWKDPILTFGVGVKFL